MEFTRGRTDPSVVEELFERPWSFDFFQAVRLLTLRDERALPVGGASPPSREAVRFLAHRSLKFSASQIQSLEPEPGGPPRMAVNFMGLVGPKGVLPWHYQDAASGDPNPLADFLDLFHHRLISLCYRAWAKYRLPVGYELAQQRDAEYDRFTSSLFNIMGLGSPKLRKRQTIPEVACLAYSGLIAQQPHNASSTRGLLADYFEVPVEITQFQGRWFRVPSASLSWLSGQGAHNQLGYGALAGDAVWNPQAAFLVSLGPLSFDRFLCFLPGEPACTALTEWTVFGTATHLEFDVQLILTAAEVPFCWLDGRVRLGLMSWLKTEEFTHHPADVVFRGHTPFDEQPTWSNS